MENPVYRIKLEVIDSENGEPIQEDDREIECDGFILLANQGNGGKAIVHDIGCDDAAALIASDEFLSTIAALGKAMRDVYDAKKALDAKNMLEKFVAELKSK